MTTTFHFIYILYDFLCDLTDQWALGQKYEINFLNYLINKHCGDHGNHIKYFISAYEL